MMMRHLDNRDFITEYQTARYKKEKQTTYITKPRGSSVYSLITSQSPVSLIFDDICIYLSLGCRTEQLINLPPCAHIL